MLLTLTATGLDKDWSNGHFITVALHLNWINIAGLLFVNLHFYIFNQRRFHAGSWEIPQLFRATGIIANTKNSKQKVKW
jgi:hypothetical protein